MAEALKDCYSQSYIERVAHQVAQETGINEQDCVALVMADAWQELELKQRMNRLAEVCGTFLPEDYEEALAILCRILPNITGGEHKYDDMLAMFVPDMVVQLALHDVDVSLKALEFMTSHGTSAEFAIRPFIMQDEAKVMAKMLEWAGHEHHHVRRLASEGCRPRLPWAMALPRFKQDPALVLPILEPLRADESLFVRKSVANNLNDIAKDNPDCVIDFVTRWKNSHHHTDWIVKHGCRTLLKQAHPEVMALFGAAPVEVKDAQLRLASDMVTFGDAVQFDFTAQLQEPLPDNMRIEYGIDYMKANGKLARKVFKISESAPKSTQIMVSKQHKFVPYSTRKHYAGKHQVAMLINGQEVACESFVVEMKDV